MLTCAYYKFLHLGELTLEYHDTGGVSAYVPYYSATKEQFHLRYAGSSGLSLPHNRQMVKVDPVRANGMPALTGQYLVDMQPDISPDDDLLVNEVLFVSNGRQLVRAHCLRRRAGTRRHPGIFFCTTGARPCELDTTP